jgi:hypothetical protein
MGLLPANFGASIGNAVKDVGADLKAAPPQIRQVGPSAYPSGMSHPALSSPQFNGSGTAKQSSGSAAPTTGGVLTTGQIEHDWDSAGGPPGAAANMARIAQAESGDTPSITQAGEPAATTGYGLYQDTPTSGSAGGWANGSSNPADNKFGNLHNAMDNSRAAVSVFKQQGYHAFTDPVGLSLPAGANGGLPSTPNEP